jgi:hypothetical protein
VDSREPSWHPSEISEREERTEKRKQKKEEQRDALGNASEDTLEDVFAVACFSSSS